MRYGPDGQVYLIDWYDMQQCHRNDPSDHDRTNGRIFRIAYHDTLPVQVNLKKLSDEDVSKRIKLQLAQLLFDDVVAKQKKKAKIQYSGKSPYFKPGAGELVLP